MSNIIKSNYIYITQDDKKIINYDMMPIPAVSQIPGMSGAGADGFKSIDYTNDAYKVDTVSKQEDSGKVTDDEQTKPRSTVMKEASAQAQDIIEKAKVKAKEIIDEAEGFAEVIKQQNFDEAKNEGYAQGYDLAQRDVEELRQALAIQLQANNEDYENKMCQLEYDMVDVMTRLIETITGIEIDDRDVILHILHRTFMGIEHSADYQIKVSQDDYQAVNSNIDSLYECVRDGSTIEIFIDEKLEKNQCLIETDSNVIDCSINEQLRNVCKELKMLSVS